MWTGLQPYPGPRPNTHHVPATLASSTRLAQIKLFPSAPTHHLGSFSTWLTLSLSPSIFSLITECFSSKHSAQSGINSHYTAFWKLTVFFYQNARSVRSVGTNLSCSGLYPRPTHCWDRIRLFILIHYGWMKKGQWRVDMPILPILHVTTHMHQTVTHVELTVCRDCSGSSQRWLI